MSKVESRFQANPEQAAYWNSESGKRWVTHDADMDRRLGPIGVELIGCCGIAGGEHVLDIGCGGGSSTQRIARAVGASGKVVGLDISEPLLELAQTRCEALSQVSFENADAQVHAFSPQSFDLLHSRFGVMFFSDPVAAFGNLLKGLRRDGRLSFVCWASAAENPWFNVPLEVAKRHLGPPEPTPPRAPGPLAFSEPAYVESILLEAGFREPQIDTVESSMKSIRVGRSSGRVVLEDGARGPTGGSNIPYIRHHGSAHRGFG